MGNVTHRIPGHLLAGPLRLQPHTGPHNLRSAPRRIARTRGSGAPRSRESKLVMAEFAAKTAATLMKGVEDKEDKDFTFDALFKDLFAREASQERAGAPRMQIFSSDLR